MPLLRTWLLLLCLCTGSICQYTVPNQHIVPVLPVENIHPPPMSDSTPLVNQLASWNNMACGINGVCKETNVTHECRSYMFSCTSCRCDSDCARYRDCCPDANLELIEDKSSQEYEDTALENYTCVSQAFKTGGRIKYAWYAMIATCPDVAGNDEQRQICEQPDGQALPDNRPIFSTQSKRTYRNLHCALCHGEIEDDRLLPWRINITCMGYVDYSSISTQADFYREALNNDACWIGMMPPFHNITRKCYGWTDNVISQCNVTGMYSEFSPGEYRLLQEACASFKQSIRVLMYYAPNEPFKNVFCAACNGFRVERYDHTLTPCKYVEPYAPIYTAPLSVLFDFNPTTLEDEWIAKENEVDCQENMVYDTDHEMCRQLVCPYAMYAQNHTCVSVMKSAAGQGYRLYVNLAPSHPMDIEPQYLEEFASRFKREQEILGQNFLAIRSSMKLKTYYYINHVTNQRKLTKMKFYYSFINDRDIPRELAEIILLNYMNENWYYYIEDKNTFVEFHKTAIPFDERLGKLPIDEPDVIQFLSPTTVLRIESFNEGPSYAYTLVYTSNSTLYTAVNDLMRCPAIVLNATEYIWEGNNIFLPARNQTLGPLQYSMKDNSVAVCSQFSGRHKDVLYVQANKSSASRSTLDTNDGYIQTILSIVCTALSCLGLLVAFLVYLAVPTLRTLPGKCNMLLFVNILIAQVVFQGGVRANVSHTACVALGILIHYFWLAAFAWKWVCAFHMFRTFTNPLKYVQKTKTLILYCIIAHAIPALVVIVYIVLHMTLTREHSTGYGADGLCFISTPLYIGIAFATPVGLVIICNLCFFANIVAVFFRKSDLERSNHRSNFQDTLILVKMSLLLGFTWTVGFVAAATQLAVLWYIFIIFNASPGVFVFIAFVLNKRVMSKFGFVSSKMDKEPPYTTPMQTTSVTNHVIAAIPASTVSSNIYETMESGHVKDNAI